MIEDTIKKSVTLTFGGKEFQIKQFSIGQIMRVAAFVANMLKDSVKQSLIQAQKKELQESTDNKADMMKIVQMFDEDEIVEFAAICLNTKDVEFVKEHVSGVGFFDVVSAVLDTNDLGELLKKVIGIAQQITKAMGSLTKK